MYNLLMQASSDYNEWEENQGRLYDVRCLTGRVLERTAKSIWEKFTVNGSPDFDALIKLPCLFTYEGMDVVGSIGRIHKVHQSGYLFEIEYTLPNDYPRIPISGDPAFADLGFGGWEHSRTHWAVKDVDLFEAATKLLHKAGNAPVVLSGMEMKRVWGEVRNRNKRVFLSHRAAYRGQVARVREALEGQGLRCFVAHEDITPSTQWQNEILNALKTMDVFIAFVTDDFHGGGWPDQEVGYAYQRDVPRVFVKLGKSDPMGMVAREQALTTSWENAGGEIIAHLKREGIL